MSTAALREPAWLRHHRVGGVPLVPGALFLAGALPPGEGSLRNVTFEAPLACEPEGAASDDREPRLLLEDLGGELGLVQADSGRRYASARRGHPVAPPASIPADENASGVRRSSTAVYAAFAQAGNQYGPAFQALRSLREGNRDLWAEVSVPPAAAAEQVWSCHPVLLDACIQALGWLRERKSGPFVLTSIESVAWHGETQTGTQIYAHRSPSQAGQTLGDVVLCADDGTPLLSLHGIRLDEVAAAEDDRPVFALDLAATFTVEPVIEFVDCIASELGHRSELSLAPYGQVFQSLLDPANGFAAGAGQASCSILRFEDWLRDAPGSRNEVSADASSFSRITLPNGLDVAHLNEYESQYLYQEIFVDRAYARGGVSIAEGDTVIDIGANIGLFSLWAAHEADDVRVIAVEPSPVVAPILEANGNQYIPNFEVVEAGASDREGVAEFTFYEKSSVFSGFATDERDDRRALGTIIRKVLENQVELESERLDEAVEDLLEGRLQGTTHACPLVTLSQLIRRLGLDRVGLLKIDAEKSDQAVLAGIEEEDWNRIEQIVIEVHDAEGQAVQAIRKDLERRGFAVETHEEELLESSGLYNLYAVRPERARVASEPAGGCSGRLAVDPLAEAHAQRLHQIATDWLEALVSYSSRADKPHLVLIAPPSENFDRALHDEVEAMLVGAVEKLPRVKLLRAREIEALYPLDSWHDPVADRLGHMPYPRAGYAALALAASRLAWAATRPESKVVVLDGDETLWQGVVGEEGVDGIRVGPGRTAFQEKLLELRRSGLLLALCSKNEVADVDAVLRDHPEMSIRDEHVATSRVGWGRKSDAIQEIAEELNLGLDAFVFIDDNPVECAEVRAALPQVWCLQIPRDDGEIGGFAEHLWPLDKGGPTTAEDRDRAARYADERKRKEFRQSTTSLSDFIEGLALEVDEVSISPEILPRASQLTQRTNQFNLSTKRRDESELREFLAEETHGGVCVSVRDRFGDYGVVGLALYAEKGEQLEVDTFLLSCRVLGRGVEHQVVSMLGEKAVSAGALRLRFDWRESPRNQPARSFLEQIHGATSSPRSPGEIRFEFPTDIARDLRFTPDFVSPTAPRSIAATSAVAAAPSEGATRLATHLAKPHQLADWARRSLTRSRNLATPYSAPNGPLEECIAEVWRAVLQLDRVGRDDLFFDLGGTSFSVVQAVSILEAEHGLSFSIVDCFENPTVAALAASKDAGGAEASAEDAKARGEARRGKRRRRRRDREET